MSEAQAIRHLWTHKTQDHPLLSDEELVIDRAEGVWVWTERGKKLPGSDRPSDWFANVRKATAAGGRMLSG
jgi:adenosylmethionine-8-amino-7-oxononanoate aminotransferase